MVSNEHFIQEISVLFADFIGFNKLARIFQPDEMMIFLNRLFAIMEEPIEKNQGVIDKIIGDGIIVTFNAFQPVNNHQEAAVNTALGILKAVRQFARKEEQKIHFGVGIASGKASCGPLGTSKFRPRTIIGHVVGRAVQLCEKSSNEDKSLLLVDANIFHETISSFEYQQIDEDTFKVNIPLLQ